MKQIKKTKLRALGYKVTSTQDFLGLSPEEAALIDLKLTLINKLKAARAAKGLTQAQLAKLIHSSQPRVAMLERGRPEISLDLICRALFALGVTRKSIAAAISSKSAA